MNKKVAAYCRVSTDKTDQKNSFSAQQKFFKNFIEHNPEWELYEVFADEGITGTSTKKRSAFNRMIDCAKNGDFDLIITKEISRFARNTLDSIYYTRELKQHGVGVIFLNDGINTLDGDAELRLSIMASLAQEESRRTSQRVKWGQQQRMSEGVVFGRSLLGYDVKKGKITVNDSGAEVVRLIFKKYVEENKGCTTIARELSAEGINPPHSNRWSNTAIVRILRNEKYCGDLVQQKTFTPDYLTHEKKLNTGQLNFITIKDHHQPIISREIFEKASKKLNEKNKQKSDKSNHSKRYPFSGKIICGKCAATYSLRQKKRNGEEIYKAWVCTEAHKNGSPHLDFYGKKIGCNNNAINSDYLTEIMQKICKNLPVNKEKIEKEIISVVACVCSQKNENFYGINSIKQKKLSLIELYTSGKISMEEFQIFREKYEEEIEFFSSENKTEIENNFDEIRGFIRSIFNGTADENWLPFFIVKNIVVYSKESIDVYIKNLPDKWSFSIKNPHSSD